MLPFVRRSWASAALLAVSLAFACPATQALAAIASPVSVRGKSVLYVYNQTKLEAARATEPSDPKRIATLQTWRDNDLRIVAYLKSLGFAVREVGESARPETVAGQSLILISESVDAIDVGSKYRNTPVPLITMENDLLGELEMTGLKNGRDYGTDENQRFLYVVNAPHPLAAGLSAGTHNVLKDEHLKMNWGKPGLGASTIATLLGEPDKAAVFCYEKGATMNGEFLAPAKRASFFVWQDTFEQLRPEGLALFKAAVLWSVSPAS